MNIDHTFRCYYRPLCLYALHYIKEVETVEDIVQDCFVRLMENQSVTNEKAWLYTTVRHACIDRLRMENPFTTDIKPTDMEGALSDDEAMERSLHEAELWTAIDSLPRRCREVFLMSKRDGKRYREIAEELGISEKTVQHQISKALKTLRGKVSDFFYFLCSLA